MKVLQFARSAVILTEPATTSLFMDGTFNQMWLIDPGDHPIFAREAGYGLDWRRYIVEHDLLHNLVADARGHPWSFALHDGAGDTPLDRASSRIREEEHIVQRLQRLMMLGECDHYGVLPDVFGNGFPRFFRSAVALLDGACGAIARPGLGL